MRKRWILIFLPFFYSLIGCEDCGPQRELTIDFVARSRDSSLILNRVYAFNNEDTVFFQFYAYPAYDASQLWTVPEMALSMHENSITYYFDFDRRQDSLTLYYRHKFFHKNGCGYVIDADLLFTEITFSRVVSVSTPYVGEKENTLLYDYSGGIRIEVGL